ncbi:MAG TPA: ferredoxin [Armatimonadetes bacterium]|nr:ferredoxin [Armatimonadota bacterium]
MAKVVVKLIYPERLIKEPIIGRMTKKFEVMPNIRRARVTEDYGEVTLEIEGESEEVERALSWLREVGVIVEPVPGSVIE